MRELYQMQFDELEVGTRMDLPQGGYIEKILFRDTYGSNINILLISNGVLSFTVLLERGMDIGEIFLGQEKITWNRGAEYLLHPDNVNLLDNNNCGWEKGFYGAVAAIGPEIFGTPDEVRTVHGTSSYSKTVLESILISWDAEQICVKGTIPIKGYMDEPVYEKSTCYIIRYGSTLIVRKDTSKNLTAERQPLDDGFHIQLAGDFVSNGGEYVLPVSKDKMLLRDSAPEENNPFEIYEFSTKLDPIRCYQYVPEPVFGLGEVSELAIYSDLNDGSGNITAEMIVNSEKNQAAFVVRPLRCFPRSLVAKRNITEPMYALEPCRTRPNSLLQKTIDGEIVYMGPHSKADSWVLVGVVRNPASIFLMESLIRKAAEKK